MIGRHRRTTFTALLVGLISLCGCESSQTQEARYTEQVQAKLKRGREEAAKVIADSKAARGGRGAAKSRRTP